MFSGCFDISGSLIALFVAELLPSGFFVTRRGEHEHRGIGYSSSWIIFDGLNIDVQFTVSCPACKMYCAQICIIHCKTSFWEHCDVLLWCSVSWQRRISFHPDYLPLGLASFDGKPGQLLGFWIILFATGQSKDITVECAEVSHGILCDRSMLEGRVVLCTAGLNSTLYDRSMLPHIVR